VAVGSIVGGLRVAAAGGNLHQAVLEICFMLDYVFNCRKTFLLQLVTSQSIELRDVSIGVVNVILEFRKQSRVIQNLLKRCVVIPLLREPGSFFWTQYLHRNWLSGHLRRDTRICSPTATCSSLACGNNKHACTHSCTHPRQCSCYWSLH
jgi:hypothetical protein